MPADTQFLECGDCNPMQRNVSEKNGSSLLWEAVIQSWMAWALLWAYIALNFAGQPNMLLLGGLALAAILLAMNGLAKTELWWTSRSPSWFRQHPIARLLHHVHNEGEMAGIAVSLVVLICQLQRGVHVHYAFVEAFTLFGIMSAANIAVHQMMPIMAHIEGRAGVLGAIVLGSLLSSLTGEPAAAIFLSEFFKKRVKTEDKEKVATALGATIGSGGGLMPFSAPPILIVWAILQSKFNWTLTDLWLFVGGACVLHVAIVAWRCRHLIASPPQSRRPENQEQVSWTSYWPLLVLTLVVALNVTYEYHHLKALTWTVDGLVGVWALVRALRNPSVVETEGDEQEGHGRHWQPLTLALLLMGLEVVGVEAEPLLLHLASFIPATAPVLVVAFVLWYLTAFTSHFADNALASRVYITVAVALTAAMGHGDLFALSVVLGALFGGFLLIPANLPNFAISAEFSVSAGGWASTAWRWYWTGIVHVIWIGSLYFLI